MKAIVKITDIKWDIDNSEDGKIGLPTKLIATFEYTGDADELEDMISDWLSDEYGYCHYGFEYSIV